MKMIKDQKLPLWEITERRTLSTEKDLADFKKAVDNRMKRLEEDPSEAERFLESIGIPKLRNENS